MSIKRFSLLLIILLLTPLSMRAGEGMWLLTMLEGHVISDMQEKGFRLTAEDIYSVNQACLKDAVVIFGGGCTGAVVSDKGLLLTNHHCGYGVVQSHSSVEHDYLTDGFFAMSQEEELPNPGLSVTFLRYMDDVTHRVLEGVETEEPASSRETKISANIDDIIKEAEEGNGYNAEVKSLFYGNQYYLFVYESFRDIRLVGAPPSSIGNFGQDHDNWMWPRHTGDFTVFRIYADANNKPADYSPDNIPYTPRKHFEISTSGVKKGDFTMLMGYPGSTEQFLYSDAVSIMTEVSLPQKIALRTTRLEVMDKHMKQSDKVRIQYASKYRGVSNSWKKWKGIIRGLQRLEAISKKKKMESRFDAWVAQEDRREEKYGEILNEFEELYGEVRDLQAVSDYLYECVGAVEVFRNLGTLQRLIGDTAAADVISSHMREFYKDYHMPIDREIFAEMMKAYHRDINPAFHPSKLKKAYSKYNGDFYRMGERLFDRSVLDTQDEFNNWLEKYADRPERALKKLEKDPLVGFWNDFRDLYMTQVIPDQGVLESNLQDLYKNYTSALMKMRKNHTFYPDANFTMRITYGNVQGYEPRDAVKYKYQTTLKGIIEKRNTGAKDYKIPDKLEELYIQKDYSLYGRDDTMPVCFIASNHTSGGNSGSPVVDAHGRLIGLNFDRNWEGTMSDVMYDPDQCRNITVDIRYVLFVIDKFADAGYLLDEMTLYKKVTP